MGGGGVVRRILSFRSGLSRAAERGFTLIETMIAMSIAIVVLLANIYLFNTAQKDFALAKSVTEATNLATNKIADFRTMTIAQIDAAAPTNTGGPLYVRQGSDEVTVEGVRFTRTWVVSAIDLQHATPPVADLVGDLVKITIDVAWMSAGKDHQVKMATFTVGRSQ